MTIYMLLDLFYRTETSEKHWTPVCQRGDRTVLTTWRPLEWKHYL